MTRAADVGQGRLGRYRLEEIVGHGGMAVVYRGLDEVLGRTVAVKVLADNLANDQSLRERFLREARLAGRLDHPAIVKVFEAGEENGRPFIVMEYVEGENLAIRLVRETKLDPAEAVAIAVDVCGGLEHAHEAGLVHRDVKPHNILLSKDGVTKLGDFGIARHAEGTRLTEIGSILGTAAYLAPEQAAGEDVTTAVDIYALGVVLYEMLTGSPPYTYETLREVLVDRHQQRVPSPREHAPALPHTMEDIVMRCLAQLPQYRPQSAAALADELRATSADLPTRLLAVTDAPPVPTHVHGQTPTAPTRIAPTLTELVPTGATHVRHRSGVSSVRRKLAIVATLVALASTIVIALALGVGLGNRDQPDRAPPREAPALEQARDLSSWLRANTG